MSVDDRPRKWPRDKSAPLQDRRVVSPIQAARRRFKWLHRIGRLAMQHTRAQTPAYLRVRIPQPIEDLAAEIFRAGNRDAAGLEQQRLHGDGVDIEGRQHLAVADGVVERGLIDAALDQRVDQEGRCGRIEPRAVELVVAEQPQDAERVVDLSVLPDLSEPLQNLGRRYRVQPCSISSITLRRSVAGTVKGP